jgi:GH35 family endo-1,4-beta-xylanase
LHSLPFLLAALLAAPVFAQQPKAPSPDLAPAAIQQRIAQYRTAQSTLTLTTPDGKPLANTPVTIRQTRHAFLFGCNGFAINPADTSQLQKDYQKRFADLLNFATLPFYWGSFERIPGQPATENRRAMAQWCIDHNIRPKGHPLCWHQVFPQWLMDKPLDEVHKLQIERITRDVSDFAGRIDTFDVVNEAVAMPNYKAEKTRIPELARQLGVVQLIKETFTAARKANPNATLILNDYDTSPKYEKLIEDCLAAGVPIDVIGIQCHQHSGYWGAQRTWDICQRFARFGKPLHFTELTLISGENRRGINYQGRNPDWPTTPEGEHRQAQQVAEFYTILFSHPAVQAITWWDFSDYRAWLGAPAGLVRKDMSPKPAYTALMDLVKGQWWTRQVNATTDAAGRVAFSAFLGQYAVDSSAGQASFTIATPGQCQAQATLSTK